MNLEEHFGHFTITHAPIRSTHEFCADLIVTNPPRGTSHSRPRLHKGHFKNSYCVAVLSQTCVTQSNPVAFFLITFFLASIDLTIQITAVFVPLSKVYYTVYCEICCNLEGSIAAKTFVDYL